MNAGLRFDWITAHDPTVVEPANALFPSFTAPAVDNVPNWKDLNPRFGVAWDVIGDGKTVVKGGVNRYVTTLTTSVASLFGPHGELLDGPKLDATRTGISFPIAT